jgi:hypothetical protein
MIGMIGLAAAKLIGNEARLQALSSEIDTLLQELEGKSVALVGNAKSLVDARYGAVIDAADIVIRLNSAPLPAILSHGSRTTWIALSAPISHDALRARHSASCG